MVSKTETTKKLDELETETVDPLRLFYLRELRKAALAVDPECESSNEALSIAIAGAQKNTEAENWQRSLASTPKAPSPVVVASDSFVLQVADVKEKARLEELGRLQARDEHAATKDVKSISGNNSDALNTSTAVNNPTLALNTSGRQPLSGSAPVVKHSTKSRRDTLTPVIELAQSQCRSPKDTAEVWATLLVLADKKRAPLIGATEDGLQYLKDGAAAIFKRKSLGKRLTR